jgi:hypothetical protein
MAPVSLRPHQFVFVYALSEYELKLGQDRFLHILYN